MERPLTAQGEHHPFDPPIPFEPRPSFKTYPVEIDPGTVLKGEPHEGNTYEYVLVTAGRP